jgi:hypothetical protein
MTVSKFHLAIEEHRSSCDDKTDTSSTDGTMSSHGEFPPRVDLLEMLAQQPLPQLAPDMIDPACMAGDEPAKQAQTILDGLNAALAANDTRALEDCFVEGQSYWKDQLALTYHLRTFKTPGVIAASLLETNKMRAIKGDIKIDGGAMFLPATPVLVSMKIS